MLNTLKTMPRRSILLVVMAISFVAMIAIWLQFVPLESAMMRTGGYGIVAYEIAFTAEQAGRIIASWDAAGRAAAQRSLLIDFAFMLYYGLFFASVTLLIARAQSGRLQTAGLALTVGSLAAAVFDALENAMLLITLQAPVITPLPPLVAGISASIKFALLILTILYWLISLIRWSILKWRRG